MSHVDSWGRYERVLTFSAAAPCLAWILVAILEYPTLPGFMTVVAIGLVGILLASVLVARNEWVIDLSLSWDDWLVWGYSVPAQLLLFVIPGIASILIGWLSFWLSQMGIEGIALAVLVLIAGVPTVRWILSWLAYLIRRAIRKL